MKLNSNLISIAKKIANLKSQLINKDTNLQFHTVLFIVPG